MRDHSYNGYGGAEMFTANLAVLNQEKDLLNITAQDLNESDNPLDNILLDVMGDYFYIRMRLKSAGRQ